MPCRQALPCFAFLHRCHPVGPGDRCGRCQTHLTHIRPDGFARDGRRLGSVGAMGASQCGARGSDEKQHQQCDLHRPLPFYDRGAGGPTRHALQGFELTFIAATHDERIGCGRRGNDKRRHLSGDLSVCAVTDRPLLKKGSGRVRCASDHFARADWHRHSRNQKFWNMRLELADQFGLILAARITLPHFSV
jgi:hypothetical protein